MSLEINTNTVATDAASNLSPTEPSTSHALAEVQQMLQRIWQLAVHGQNPSSANSQITDVDMATAMASCTSHQILQQAGISTLAQAQKQPQAVLPLLR